MILNKTSQGWRLQGMKKYTEAMKQVPWMVDMRMLKSSHSSHLLSGSAYSAGRFRFRFRFRKSAPISPLLASRLGADYQCWLQTSHNNGIDKWRRCSSTSSYCFRKCSLKIEKRERSGVHDMSQLRGQYGEYHHPFPQLKADGEWFFQYFRMDIETFTYILWKIEHRLIKNWCNLHQQTIPPEERFVITLR